MKTLAQTDPRRIACPHCAAAIGEWCEISRRNVRTMLPGFVHTYRSKAAHRFRMAGATPAAQLPLFDATARRAARFGAQR